MNFEQTFLSGQTGGNKGIPAKRIEGLENISKAINGIQKNRKYVIAGASKSGKTTLTDAFFVLSLYLEYVENPFNIEWIYFSFEIPRVEKEFEFASFFLFYDHGLSFAALEEGSTKDGKRVVEISSEYLMGRILDDNGNIVKVNPFVLEKLKKVYYERIEPLFGIYNHEGVQIKKGLITFITDRDNPTGLDKFLRNYAKENGVFNKSVVYGNNRDASYIPNDPNKYTIVITDHVRKILREKGLSLKETVDMYSNNCCTLRDVCNFTFVDIIHLNRNIASLDRMSFSKDMLYPTADDLKETGNLAEDCNYLFTVFNPNDEKYKLKSHFGYKLRDSENNIRNPEYKTLHLVESRHCSWPQHFGFEMNGASKYFKKVRDN